MAGSLASINIKFFADLKQFSSQMQNANRKISKVGKSMKQLGKGLSVGVTAPFLAFSGIALKNWDKQEKAIAQVEAGLRSTGGAVGYTSEQLQKMAADLQATSLFGDEEILQGTTAQLLTFTNIAGEQFKRTQLAALDLSAKLGTDLKSSSIQLGKALNDPVANLSALSRSGIQFSADQKQVINSLVATNRLADAQTIILDELANQYGGAAEAAAKAGLGPFKQLSNSIGDLTEDFGKIIGEALLPFAEKLKDLVSSFQNLDDGTKKTIVVIASLAAVIGPLLIALGFMMTTVIPGLTVAFSALTAVIIANPFGALAVVIAAVASAFFVFGGSVDEVVEKQSLLSEVAEKASKSIVKEKAKMTELLSVARDVSLSDKRRIAAIKELNKISPEHLGNLSLETINTQAAKTAVDSYNESLLQTARIRAAQSKLQEISSKKLDLQIEAAKQIERDAKTLVELKKNANTQQDFMNIKIKEKIGFGVKENALLGARIAKLKDEEEQILNIIKAKSDAAVVVGGNGTGRKKVTSLSNWAKVDVVPVNQVAEDNVLLQENLNNTVSMLDNFKVAGQQIAFSVSEAFGQMGNDLVEGFGLANTGFEGFVKGLAKTIMKLISMLLSQSIAHAIAGASASAAATGPAAVFTSAPFIATAVAGVVGAFASIPKFENGGIMPGNSFSGDKLFARINSGEMILNQRQQSNLNGMLSPYGGSQDVNVHISGSLVGKGRDLVAVIDSYSAKKLRTT